MALKEITHFDISGIETGAISMAFDGDYLYFYGAQADTIFKVSRKGELIDTYDVTGSQTDVDGLCFDGKDFWAVSKADGTLNHYNSEFVAIETIDISGTIIVDPQYMATDGKIIAVFGSTALDLSFMNKEGQVIKTLDTSTIANKVRGVAFDGHNLWVATQDVDRVIQIDYDGNKIQTLSLSGITDLPRGHCFDGNYDRKTGNFDGKNIWILDSRGEDVLCLSRN